MTGNKKILFIVPDFYEYPVLIKRELEKSGAKTELYYTAPRKLIDRILSVYSKKLYSKRVSEYFRKLELKLKDKDFDYVLVIRPDLLPDYFPGNLRKLFWRAIFIQYLWDDINYFPRLAESLIYFDRILTYNIIEAEQYGLIYRPFFHAPANKTGNSGKSRYYNLFYIGSYQSERLIVLEKLADLNKDLKSYLRLYINPLEFINRGIPFRKIKFFRFFKMSYRQMMGMISNSAFVLDISRRGQSGVGTRAFEAMGSGSGLVTTNCNISKYEFFREYNFLILDRDEPVIDRSLLRSCNSRNIELPKDDYHISKWVRDVFGD